MLPPAVTDAAIDGELPGAVAWAKRHDIAMDTRSLANRILRAVFVHPVEGEKFYLQGVFDDYKALPPIWEWRDEAWSSPGALRLSPNPGESPFGSPMFIRHGAGAIICAPFNRLAFGVHGGPHSDWENPAQWTTAGRGHVYAVTIGDMLNLIWRDFLHSKGRMA